MTITREQIEMYASAADATQTFGMDKGKLIAVEPEHMQELARMALAGMEAEPVKRVNSDQMHRVCLEATRHLDKYGAMAKEVNKLLGRITPQPLTTSERAELENYRNARKVVPDEVIVLLNHLEDVLPYDAFNLIDVKTWNNVSMLSRPDAFRAAMLQGKADGNSPVIPDGWVACSERMPDEEGHYLVWASASRLDGYCDHMDIAAYQGGVWSNEFGWCVTQWQPLPEIPHKGV